MVVKPDQKQAWGDEIYKAVEGGFVARPIKMTSLAAKLAFLLSSVSFGFWGFGIRGLRVLGFRV